MSAAMRVGPNGRAALRRVAADLADARLASQGVSMGDPMADAYLEEVTDLIADALAGWIEDGCDPCFEITVPSYEDRREDLREHVLEVEAERQWEARTNR